ncbi:hypothetical protein ISS07_01410 [Candidatus Woesearchaeota archaeon]|nr:hypothetical protein [Candidatus Woesearchaeota archaeon]
MKRFGKKAQEASGGGMALTEIMGFLLLIALVVFLLFWYGDLGNKIIGLIKSIF